MPKTVILEGDVRDRLRELPDNSISCVVTSPPYWGLRNYSLAPSLWGGRADCEHEWEKIIVPAANGITHDRGMTGETLSPSSATRGVKRSDSCSLCKAWRGCLGSEPTPSMYLEHLVEIFREIRRVLHPNALVWLNLGDSYANDGKWGGETGGKQAYLPDSDRKRVGRERRYTGLKPKDLLELPSDIVRALREDGWWLRSRIPWVKPESVMPNSCRDRPTTSVEYVFLLAKTAKPFYDKWAAMIPSVSDHASGNGYKRPQRLITGGRGSDEPWKDIGGQRARREGDWFLDSLRDLDKQRGMLVDDNGDPLAFMINPSPMNWSFCEACERVYSPAEGNDLLLWCEKCELAYIPIATLKRELIEVQLPLLAWTNNQAPEHPRSEHANRQLHGSQSRISLCGRNDAWGSHYAAFPPFLIEPMVKSGTTERGVCSNCFAPWVRTIEKKAEETKIPSGWDTSTGSHRAKKGRYVVQKKYREQPRISAGRLDMHRDAARADGNQHDNPFPSVKTLGWDPSCKCESGEPIPATILDPFGGSGTVGLVANALGRDAVLIEQNPNYCRLAARRIRDAAPLLNEVEIK